MMKVLTINGTPHLQGCTDRALREVEKTLADNGIKTERVNVGNKDILGTPTYYAGSNGRLLAFLIKAIDSLRKSEGIPAQERTSVTSFCDKL